MLNLYIQQCADEASSQQDLLSAILCDKMRLKIPINKMGSVFSSAALYESFECLAEGSFGCIVKNALYFSQSEQQIQTISINIKDIQLFGYADINIGSNFDSISSILSSLKNVMAYKVFIKGSEKDQENCFKNELAKSIKAYEILKNETTLCPITFDNKLFFGAKLKFKKPIWIKMAKAPVKQKTITLLFQSMCEGDLSSKKDTFKLDNKHINSLLDNIAKLHENKFFHRDIKLQNILVCKDNLKLNDFGISVVLPFVKGKGILEGGQSELSLAHYLPIPPASDMQEVLNIFDGTPGNLHPLISKYKNPNLYKQEQGSEKDTIINWWENKEKTLNKEKSSFINWLSIGYTKGIKLHTLQNRAQDKYDAFMHLLKKNDEYALYLALSKLKITDDVLSSNLKKLLDQNKTIKDWHGVKGGRGQNHVADLKKTNKVATIGTLKRIIYTAKSGKQYVKYKKQFVALAELKKKHK